MANRWGNSVRLNFGGLQNHCSEPVESRIFPKIGAATAFAPKIGISIRLANWSFNPIDRITKEGMNITEE